MIDTSKPLPNVWSSARNKEVSKNYHLVMDRTWYCIAGSTPAQGEMDLFWEYNIWIPGKESQRFTNHTITRNLGKSKVKDYGIWNGFILDGLFAMQPTITLLGMLRIPLPTKFATNWLAFPENDALDQVWTYYGDVRGKRIVFIWALTPHLSDEAYQTELKRLEEENGVDIAENPLYKVQWSPSYKPGDSGEHKIN